jgi:hypothetical protein
VLGRHGPLGDATDERRVQEIDVKVQDVEFVQPPPNLIQHDHV